MLTSFGISLLIRGKFSKFLQKWSGAVRKSGASTGDSSNSTGLSVTSNSPFLPIHWKSDWIRHVYLTHLFPKHGRFHQYTWSCRLSQSDGTFKCFLISSGLSFDKGLPRQPWTYLYQFVHRDLQFSLHPRYLGEKALQHRQKSWPNPCCAKKPTLECLQLKR